MLYVKQTPTGVNAHFEGDFPDLVCDLVIAYKIVEMRGVALNINVPRLVDLIGGDMYIDKLAREYEARYGRG